MPMSQATLAPKRAVYRGSMSQGLAGYPSSAVFSSGDSGIQFFRQPTAIKTQAGTLLVVAQGQTTTADQTCKYIVAKRSTSWTSAGPTFGALATILTENDAVNYGLGNPTIYQHTDGTIYLMFLRGSRSGLAWTSLQVIMACKSTDDGVTWTKLDGTTITSGYAANATDISTSYAGWMIQSNVYVGSIASFAGGVFTLGAAHGLTSGRSYKMKVSGATSGDGLYVVSYNSGTHTTSQVAVTGWSGTLGASATYKLVGNSVIPAGGIGVRMADGTVRFPVYYRYTENGTGNDAFPTWLATSDFSTWTAGNICDESKSDNYGGIEPSIAETTAGNLLINCRDRGTGSGSPGIRCSFTHTAGNALLSDQVNESVADSSTKGGICRIGATKHVLLHSSNIAGYRSNLLARYSTDGGATWSAGRLVFAGGAGYSTISHAGNEKLIAVWESGNGPGDVSSEATCWMGEVRIAILSWNDLLQNTGKAQFDYHFDEYCAATADVTYPGSGAQVRDYGATRFDLIVNGTLTGGVQGAVIASGAGNYVNLNTARRMCFDPPSGSALVVEVKFSTSDTAGYLMGSAASGSSRWFIQVGRSTGGIAEFTIVDSGGNTYRAATTNSVSDGAEHTLTCVYVPGTGLYVVEDGVQRATTSTGTLTFNSAAGDERRISEDSAGGNLLQTLTLTRLRITTGYVPSSFIYGQANGTGANSYFDKTTLSHFPANGTIAHSGYKLLLDPLSTDRHLYADNYWSRPLPGRISGLPVRTGVEHGVYNDRYSITNPYSTGWQADYSGSIRYDSTIGWHYRINDSTSASTLWTIANTKGSANNRYGFLYDSPTRQWTVVAFIKPADLATFQFLLATTDYTKTEGIRIGLNTSGTVLWPNLLLYSNSTTEYNQSGAASAGAITTTTDWWMVAYVFDSSLSGANKVKLYTAKVQSGTTLGSTHFATPATPTVTAPVSPPGDLDIQMFYTSTGVSNRFTGGVTGIAIHNTAWSLAQLQAYYDWKALYQGT